MSERKHGQVLTAKELQEFIDPNLTIAALQKMGEEQEARARGEKSADNDREEQEQQEQK